MVYIYIYIYIYINDSIYNIVFDYFHHLLNNYVIYLLTKLSNNFKLTLYILGVLSENRNTVYNNILYTVYTVYNILYTVIVHMFYHTR